MTGNAVFFWDGYLHWARELEAHDPEFSLLRSHPDASAPLYESIFIRLNLPFNARLFERIVQKLREVWETHAPGSVQPSSPDRATGAGGLIRESGIQELRFLREGFAFDLLEILIGFEHALKEECPPEFFIYRPVALSEDQHLAYEAIFTIIDVGAPSRVSPEIAPYLASRQAVSESSEGPIAAIIDNDIGFLNRRFRDPNRPETATRFAAFWAQSQEKMDPAGPKGFARAHIGRVLTGADIDRLLSEYKHDERAAYTHLNTALHSRAEYKLAPPIGAHGAMVCDLAFGSGEADKVGIANVPILAVQLPPEAAEDTSGTASETYIVQGVRWICYWARYLGQTRPLVINISYGVLAGQKDGGKFLEEQIAKEIRLGRAYKADPNGPGQDVKVVFAQGNGHNQRQVARLRIEPGTEEAINWVIPPDNHAPCFMELRGLGTDSLTNFPTSVAARLEGPVGTSIDLQAPPGGAGIVAAVPPLTGEGRTTPARLYNVPRRDFEDPSVPAGSNPSVGARRANPGFSMLAIAPTRELSDGIARAPAGTWKLSLTNSGSRPVEVILQIQNGDTAPGYRRAGRQSHFEGPFVATIEDGYPARTVGAPLTNYGAISAFATSPEPGIIAAGSRQSVFDGETIRSEYSARGAKWSAPGRPDAERRVDALYRYGRRCSGTYSGTRARLSGTSAAAALVSRDLILEAIL